MTPRERKALGILAGCPDGATEDALARHGIPRATLHALVVGGFATVDRQRIARLPSLIVSRFHITPRGRAAVQ